MFSTVSWRVSVVAGFRLQANGIYNNEEKQPALLKALVSVTWRHEEERDKVVNGKGSWEGQGLSRELQGAIEE